MLPQSDTATAGSSLLVAYSAGMAIPFLLMAFFLTRLDRVLAFARKYSQQVSVVTGVFLIIIGIMLYTNSFGRIAALIDVWESSIGYRSNFFSGCSPA